MLADAISFFGLNSTLRQYDFPSTLEQGRSSWVFEPPLSEHEVKFLGETYVDDDTTLYIHIQYMLQQYMSQ
jgi:hypothetical protein